MTEGTGKADKTPSFGLPGAFAICRNQVGGDWAAALFLYRIKYRWQIKKKLERLGKDWVAMPRKAWAAESGLSIGEFKNRALPKLRKQPYVDIRAMKLKPGGPKILWVSLDPLLCDECTMPPDMDPVQTGLGGPEMMEWSAYPYKYSEEKKWKLVANSEAAGDKSVAELLRGRQTLEIGFDVTIWKVHRIETISDRHNPMTVY